jgi:peptide/nickel transport system ATP-binding protein
VPDLEKQQEPKALVVKNLTVHYETDDGIVEAVSDVEFFVNKGTTLGLVGETGAGKTTTALSILRLIPDPPGVIKSGQIEMHGIDIMNVSEKNMERIRGKEVSMIFQDPMTALNPVMSVGDQIAEVIRIHAKESKKAALQKAKEMLEMVGIPSNRSDEYPHQFSGGMKQRVGIAMALSCNPKLLIADEPTTALDVTIQAQVLDLMKSLKSRFDMSMLMITHDLGVVSEICDTVAIMYGGRIVEYGTATDIFDNTRHPYTIGLFGSVPNIDKPAGRLKPIKGLMPDPTNLPPGCPFHPRCDRALDICAIKQPKTSKLSDTHTVRCLLFETEV